MSLGPWQLIIIAIVILVLFGRGRISEMMGDFGKGINSFKKGMNEGDEKPGQPSPRIEGPAHEAKPATEAAKEPVPSDRGDSAN
ncbi:twin-arginine translocase TatA/TatE family subunit [Altererythrobacter arenosus]|uniref:Sec-independent protein translocase protein TatA n=1 Tax=Altererythrobacter arenosus TaxID=3032592 RepID=A0ABY8FT72_9SPHN|nr:twin-arginine translocase TatA/TatE family subunit [Altererythrobacter sp. CAU 1644]WFL78032.1 twin-arginine translocase TatA/TatE family subunit [Altererythrobacter sp. CAU 1644]